MKAQRWTEALRWIPVVALALAGAAACSSDDDAPGPVPTTFEPSITDDPGHGAIAVLDEDHPDDLGVGTAGTWKVVDGCVVLYQGVSQETGDHHYVLPAFSAAGDPHMSDDGAFTFHGTTWDSPAYFGLNSRTLEPDEMADVTVPEACPEDVQVVYVASIAHPPAPHGDAAAAPADR